MIPYIILYTQRSQNCFFKFTLSNAERRAANELPLALWYCPKIKELYNPFNKINTKKSTGKHILYTFYNYSWENYNNFND
jgi:hypothetical protein